jgi:hypothetical protein
MTGEAGVALTSSMLICELKVCGMSLTQGKCSESLQKKNRLTRQLGSPERVWVKEEN